MSRLVLRRPTGARIADIALFAVIVPGAILLGWCAQ